MPWIWVAKCATWAGSRWLAQTHHAVGCKRYAGGHGLISEGEGWTAIGAACLWEMHEGEARMLHRSPELGEAAKQLRMKEVERTSRLEFRREAKKVRQDGGCAHGARRSGVGQQVQMRAKGECYGEGSGGERKRRHREVDGGQDLVAAAAFAEVQKLPQPYNTTSTQVSRGVIPLKAN